MRLIDEKCHDDDVVDDDELMMIMGVLDGTRDASSIDSTLEDPRITFAFCILRHPR